jgi:HTH-type transcriptional regulator/antitoxin HigA
MYSFVFTENSSVSRGRFALKPIRTEEDYREALEQIDKLIDSDKDSEEYRVLELLNELVFAYEERHMPGARSAALAEIRWRMDQLGLTVHDMGSLLRSQEPIEEILEGKKPLTLKMMRMVHQHLGVPAEVLLQ